MRDRGNAGEWMAVGRTVGLAVLLTILFSAGLFAEQTTLLAYSIDREGTGWLQTVEGQKALHEFDNSGLRWVGISFCTFALTTPKWAWTLCAFALAGALFLALPDRVRPMFGTVWLTANLLPVALLSLATLVAFRHRKEAIRAG